MLSFSTIFTTDFYLLIFNHGMNIYSKHNLIWYVSSCFQLQIWLLHFLENIFSFFFKINVQIKKIKTNPPKRRLGLAVTENGGWSPERRWKRRLDHLTVIGEMRHLQTFEAAVGPCRWACLGQPPFRMAVTPNRRVKRQQGVWL